MNATITPTMTEIGCSEHGRPSYRWVTRWIVNTPDGGKIAPPMTLKEAKDFCKSHDWKAEVIDGRLTSY